MDDGHKTKVKFSTNCRPICAKIDFQKVQNRVGKQMATMNHSELIAAFSCYPEHMAVVNDSIEELDIALAADDGDCDYEHHYGDTPLMLAIHLHRMQIVEHLLAVGANVNLVTSRLRATAAKVAAQYGNERIMTMLIQAGANVQAPLERSNLCHYAAQNTDAGVLRLLAEAGVPVDEPDGSGRRPIDYAAENKNEQIMSCLLTAGCSVVSKFCVSAAARNSNHMVLAMVIAAGADIAASDLRSLCVCADSPRGVKSKRRSSSCAARCRCGCECGRR
jgi:ankyrin repeat protein